MNYAVRFHRYRPGQLISVRDAWLDRWCEATVVTASLTLVTAVSGGGHTYHDLPASPKWVRPIHIVRARSRELRRAA